MFYEDQVIHRFKCHLRKEVTGHKYRNITVLNCFKYLSSQNTKTLNLSTYSKVLHLPNPNYVYEPPIFSPCVYQILTNSRAGTPGCHDARDDIPVNQLS